MYLGFTIALSGVATSLGSVGPFSILFVFIAITHFWYIPFEERWLTKKFGEEYENYKKCTPRWLLQVKRTP